MVEGIGQAFQGLATFCIASLFVAWPLGLWKLIEIVVWLFKHVEVGVKWQM